MISPIEMRRILGEWRVRLQRIKEIVQPPSWDETEWRQFSQALALLVRQHGRSWIIDPKVYWDLRWKLQDGGELICQVEHIPGEKTSLVVAQNGGFAEAVTQLHVAVGGVQPGRRLRARSLLGGRLLEGRADHAAAAAGAPVELPAGGAWLRRLMRCSCRMARGRTMETIRSRFSRRAMSMSAGLYSHGASNGSHAIEVPVSNVPPLSRTDYQNEDIPRYAYQMSIPRPSCSAFLYR